MKARNIKDLKTTILGIVAAALVFAGLIWPEKIDAETSETIKTAADELLGSGGMLIALIAGILAKDK